MSEQLADLAFVIEWLGWDRQEVGTSEIQQIDLTDAIAAACILMMSGGPADEAHGFFVRRKGGPENLVERNVFEVPAPSDYDVAHLADILAGHGDWFSAKLFRLIMKADGANTERLRMAFRLHVEAFENWRNR